MGPLNPLTDTEDQTTQRVHAKALLGSFALSLLGGALIFAWYFAFSPAFFAPAVALVYPMARGSVAPQIRTIARIALGLALAGLLAVMVCEGSLIIHSPETGLRIVAVSLLSPLASLVVWGVLAK